MAAIASAGSEKEIFSTHDAARVCRVTPMTVIRWIEEGRIPAFKTVGGHRRILRADLEQFCQTRGMPFEVDDGTETRRVLIIESDAALRETIADAARAVDPGLAIELAGDAFTAGQLVGAFRPQLIFLDAKVPGLDALDVCARLTDGAGAAGVRVAVLVASGGDAERAFRARGATACLPRPPTAPAIDLIVREAFRIPTRDTTLAPRSILVVDGDVRFARGLVRDLEGRLPGTRVASCATGVEALLAIGAERHEVVLLGTDLDDVDWQEMARRIRAHAEPGKLAIFAMAARGATVKAQAGAQGVLVKPFGAQELLARLGVGPPPVATPPSSAAARGATNSKGRRATTSGGNAGDGKRRR